MYYTFGVIEKSSKQKILLTFENLTFKHLVLNDDQHICRQCRGETDNSKETLGKT